MPATASLVDLLHDAQWDPTSDRLLDYFLKYTTARNLSLYPAQEEAILELLDGKNVDPQHADRLGQVAGGVGDASSRRWRAASAPSTPVPIKALVNEKWMALCREFGPGPGRACRPATPP